MHSIAANEVHLYQLDLDDSDSVFAGLQDQLLSAVEKDKANSFVQEIHRVRYQRGRSWIRTILARYVDVSASELEIKEQDRGKPFLEQCPIEFNLSHSENQAVLAVAWEQAVGIDIERFSRLVELEALSKIHFLESEREWLANYSGTEKQQAFFWLWTAKEARMKITGEGFALPSKNIEVSFEGDLPIAYQLPTDHSVYLTSLTDMLSESACCLASTRPDPQVVYQ